ncbi:hypothetical protein WJX72_004235 [[Myrmecia] bisecta]|uniref:Uncharacterized protein n=1 Tax=[Myrmecia] bisecta TaxID=41462 RepID=A0AAW1PP83_9CHLO
MAVPAGSGQELTQAYLQHKAALAAERQQLLQRQSELTKSRLEHGLRDGPGDAASRAAQRQQLIDKLQEGQASQQARLEALKRDAALRDADPWAGQQRDPAYGRQPSRDRDSYSRDSPGSTQQRLAYAPAAEQSGRFEPNDNGRPGGKSPYGSRELQQYGDMRDSQQQNPLFRRTMPGAQPYQTTVTPPNRPPPWGASQAAPGQQQHSTAQHSFPFPGMTLPVSRVRPWSQQADANAPPYVRELQSQLQALISTLQNKLMLAGEPPQQPMPTFAPLQSFGNPYASQPYATANQQTLKPATPGPALPAALQTDSEMKQLWEAHTKEMAKLNLQLERARTLAELQELKNRIAKLAEGPAPGEPEAAQAAAEPQEAEEEEEEVVMVKKPVKKPPKKKPPRRRVETPEESEEEFEVPEQYFSEEEEPYYERRHRRDRSRNQYRHEMPEEPVMRKVEPYRIFSLYLTLERMMPILQPGSYSIAFVLYDGYEPVMASADTPVKVVTPFKEAGAGENEGRVTWAEKLVMPDVRLRSSSMLVLEVHCLRPGPPADGTDPKPEMVAWAFAQALQNGEVVGGLQSVPVYKLPLMLKAQRKFTFDHAFIDFSMADTEPVEPEPVPDIPVKPPVAEDEDKDAPPPRPKGPEDVKGVPTAAWCRVQRGVPPSEPFKPGEGFMLMIDSARYLPGNVTVSKVTGSVWSCDRQLLCAPFEALCTLDSDAYLPSYNCQISLGSGPDRFDDPTATLLLQIDTVERESRELRCVGYAALPLFIDPRENGQPVRKNINDYVLNQGGFQIPLHIAPPDRDDPTFKGSSLEGSPRVPCASILLRLLDMNSARHQRNRKPPKYSDRAYDTSRALPNAVETNVFYIMLLREPLPVRTALKRLINPALDPAGAPAGGQKKDATAGPQKAGGLFGFGGRFGKAKEAVVVSNDAEEADSENEGEPEVVQEAQPVVVDEGPQLPDAELQEIMKAKLTRPELWNDVPLNYGRNLPYNKELGFHVAIDSAMKLPRALPAAAIMSLTPPGAFYQEIPVIDDVAVTLQYDMDAPLTSPTWLDGYHRFTLIPYDPALCVILDVRTVIPGSGTTAPVGWAALPVFDKGTRYVATGHYQLPLFQGLPSKALLEEMAAAGDMEAAVADNLKAGRLKYLVSNGSVFVRLMDDQRAGQLDDRADSTAAKTQLRFPTYLADMPRLLLEFTREARGGRTYDNARSKDIPVQLWIHELNDAIIAATGLDQVDDYDSALDTERSGQRSAGSGRG